MTRLRRLVWLSCVARQGLLGMRPETKVLRHARLGTTEAPTVRGLNATVAKMRGLTRLEWTDEELAWFARDRRGDAVAAAAKAERCDEWRQRGWGGLAADRAGLERLAATEAAKRVGYLAAAPDVLGRPVVVVIAKRHRALDRSLRSSQALCISVLESAIDQLEAEGREQLAAICDLRGVGTAAVDIPFLIWLVNTLRNYYPKRLGHIALVDPPALLFQTAWSVIEPYLGKHATLVRLVSSSDVRNHYFAPGSLPPDLR